MYAPFAWQETPTQGSPLSLFSHVNPPSQGGRLATGGRPPYLMSSECKTAKSIPGLSMIILWSLRSKPRLVPLIRTPETTKVL